MNEKQVKIIRGILIAVIILSILIIVVGELTNNFARFFPAREGNVLFFYHWWTSPGERAALNELINVFTAKYPEIVVLPSSVVTTSSAGGGVELFKIMQQMLISGEPPDAFQMHAGYELKTYVDANLIAPVDEIWEKEQLGKVIPKIIKSMCKFNNNYYSIPINIHRTNVVWYNKEILDENKINASKLTDWNSFFEACDKLRAAGIKYPIQLATTWTAQHTFDQIVVSQGIDLYEDWINGKIVYDEDPRLLKALEIFKKYLSYVNPDNADLGWEVAIARIIKKEGAFNVMGDWANGEFMSSNQVYNKDYGTFIVPETRDYYGLVIDTFQRPISVQHPESARKWLEVVASKEGQDAFNPLKGSISARIDTDVSKYSDYQKTAIFDFVTLKYMFPAVSNGAPKDFEVREQQIIAEFIKDLDAKKAARAFATYQKENRDKYTIEWELD